MEVRKKAIPLHTSNDKNKKNNGLVAQLNRASDYGSEGYRFESCRDHKKELKRVPFLFQHGLPCRDKGSPANSGGANSIATVTS